MARLESQKSDNAFSSYDEGKIRPAIYTNTQLHACHPLHPDCGGFTEFITYDAYYFIDEDSNCQECGKAYEDDSEDDRKTWIGCDNCWRWFHYGRAGFKRKPSKKQRLNAESANLKSKTSHKLCNLNMFTYLMLIRIDKTLIKVAMCHYLSANIEL